MGFFDSMQPNQQLTPQLLQQLMMMRGGSGPAPAMQPPMPPQAQGAAPGNPGLPPPPSFPGGAPGSPAPSFIPPQMPSALPGQQGGESALSSPFGGLMQQMMGGGAPGGQQGGAGGGQSLGGLMQLLQMLKGSAGGGIPSQIAMTPNQITGKY